MSPKQHLSDVRHCDNHSHPGDVALPWTTSQRVGLCERLILPVPCLVATDKGHIRTRACQSHAWLDLPPMSSVSSTKTTPLAPIVSTGAVLSPLGSFSCFPTMAHTRYGRVVKRQRVSQVFYSDVVYSYPPAVVDVRPSTRCIDREKFSSLVSRECFVALNLMKVSWKISYWNRSLWWLYHCVEF